MKTTDLIKSIAHVSISKLETSPRIEKRSMIGYYAVVSGDKIWSSNLLTPADASSSIEKYNQILGPQDLKIVYVIN